MRIYEIVSNDMNRNTCSNQLKSRAATATNIVLKHHHFWALVVLLLP